MIWSRMHRLQFRAFAESGSSQPATPRHRRTAGNFVRSGPSQPVISGSTVNLVLSIEETQRRVLTQLETIARCFTLKLARVAVLRP